MDKQRKTEEEKENQGGKVNESANPITYSNSSSSIKTSSSLSMPISVNPTNKVNLIIFVIIFRFVQLKAVFNKSWHYNSVGYFFDYFREIIAIMLEKTISLNLKK